MKKLLIHLMDLLLLPAVLSASLVMKLLRRAGIHRLRYCLKLLRLIGVYPLQDHYYDPLFNDRHLKRALSEDRVLSGIDWNIPQQLALLDAFHFVDELRQFSVTKQEDLQFFYNNDAFASGDAEFLYNMIRYYKPRTIIEIGSGYSTLMAAAGIKKNAQEAPATLFEHICIEPYEMPWLEKTGATIVRQVVENVDRHLFHRLKKNDILFIDSSHMIRPQGDVLTEYLEILPMLNSGVIVHIHDIFSPKDYPDKWIRDEVRFWNEQYLLEAFLTFNNDFKIIGALNFLKHHYPDQLVAKCPFLKEQFAFREPGSFWIQKV